jgi:hypothetical protein
MKLAKIQAALKAPKSQTNSFGKYKYRSCEDILEAVKPLLDGALLTLSDNIIVVNDRFYVEATAQFIDGEFSTMVKAFAREPFAKKGADESQITGMASSYARKYALNGLFLIDDTKDADTVDNRNSEPASEAKQEPEPRGKPQLLALLSGMDTENKVKEFRTTLTETERTLIRAEAVAMIKDFRINQIENKE